MLADALPDGWRLWLDWLELIAPENLTEIRRWNPTPVGTSATSASWDAAGPRRTVGADRVPARNTRSNRYCAARADPTA